MKYPFFRHAVVLILISSCSKSSDNAPASDSSQQPPPVNAQTTPAARPAAPAVVQPQFASFVANPTLSPANTTPTLANTTNTAMASGTITGPAAPIPQVGLQNLKGWWISGADASPSEDISFNVPRSLYACRAFTLINSSQSKLANGWECWTNDKKEVFHVARLGTISSITSNRVNYTVTGGCDHNSLNTNQFFGYVLAGSNPPSAITISSTTTASANLYKKTPGPTVDGWYLEPQATNWTVMVGCLDSSGTYSLPNGLSTSELFDLAK